MEERKENNQRASQRRDSQERDLTGAEQAMDLPTEAFTLVGGAVDKDLGRDDVSKRQEHLQNLRVGELLRQVIDEDVTAFRT